MDAGGDCVPAHRPLIGPIVLVALSLAPLVTRDAETRRATGDRPIQRPSEKEAGHRRGDRDTQTHTHQKRIVGGRQAKQH